MGLFNTALFIFIRISLPRVPFMLAHWSYVFPLSTFSTATLAYASVAAPVSGTSAHGLTIMLVSISVILCSVAFIWCAVLTVLNGFRRKLGAREAKVLSEETA